MAAPDSPAVAAWTDEAIAAGRAILDQPALRAVPDDRRELAAAATGFSMGVAVGLRVGIADIAGARRLLAAHGEPPEGVEDGRAAAARLLAAVERA